MRSLLNGERLVLTFHGIGEIPAHVGVNERPFWCVGSEFTAILDEINRESQQAGLPIHITFDDGNDTDVRLALPALVARGLTAHFFVCVGRLGKPGYLYEAQVVELRDAGMRIGSHGWDHIDWRRANDATMDRELRISRERLSDILNQDVDEVAIPFGSYDRRVLRILRRGGIRTVYTSDGGRSSGRDWIVSRVTYTSSWDAATLRRVASVTPSLKDIARLSLARLVKRHR